MDEILAEVDKDQNGEVDYEEVGCFCMLSRILHDDRKTLETSCTKADVLVTPMCCSLSHHISPGMCIARHGSSLWHDLSVALMLLPGPVHVYAPKPSAFAAQFCEMMRGMQSSSIQRATTAYRKGAIL